MSCLCILWCMLVISCSSARMIELIEGWNVYDYPTGLQTAKRFNKPLLIFVVSDVCKASQEYLFRLESSTFKDTLKSHEESWVFSVLREGASKQDDTIFKSSVFNLFPPYGKYFTPAVLAAYPNGTLLGPSLRQAFVDNFPHLVPTVLNNNQDEFDVLSVELENLHGFALGRRIDVPLFYRPELTRAMSMLSNDVTVGTLLFCAAVALFISPLFLFL